MTAVPDRPDVTLLALYDRALPQVYGYLMARCGDRAVAEDLTSETFLAVAAVRKDVPLTVGWLIGVARHKLVDHWRWQPRQRRLLQAVEGSSSDSDDPWDVELDRLHAHVVLARLAPQHRAALTLRYLDGLSVPESAAVLGRAWPRPRPCWCAPSGVPPHLRREQRCLIRSPIRSMHCAPRSPPLRRTRPLLRPARPTRPSRARTTPKGASHEY